MSVRVARKRGAAPTAANNWSAKQTFSGEVQIDGALNHDGSQAGFFGKAPVSQPAAIAALANNLSDTTTDGTLETMTGLDTVSQAALSRNLSELAAKIDAIRQVLIDLGHTAA